MYKESLTDKDYDIICDEIKLHIVNEDGTELLDGRPENTLTAKWDKKYPPTRNEKPCSPILGHYEDGRPIMNYTCVLCHEDRCRHSNNWKIPAEDLEEWKEYKRADHEYDRIHNKSMYNMVEDMIKSHGKTYEDYLDLVALGEISDVMFQGTAETRYLISEGLSCISNLGFQSLIEAQSFSLKDKANYPYLGLTPIDIAFYISPLINAVTRVGTMSEKEVMFLAFVEPKRELASTKRGAKQGDIEIACKQFARIAGNIRNRQNKEKRQLDDRINVKNQRYHTPKMVIIVQHTYICAKIEFFAVSTKNY